VLVGYLIDHIMREAEGGDDAGHCGMWFPSETKGVKRKTQKIVVRGDQGVYCREANLPGGKSRKKIMWGHRSHPLEGLKLVRSVNGLMHTLKDSGGFIIRRDIR